MTQAFFPATPEESLGADTLTAQRLRTRAGGGSGGELGAPVRRSEGVR
jgi:hypothetical protein